MAALIFQEEKKLWKTGYRCVVGLDEAGRGPLAGPVVACAVAINRKSDFHRFNIRKTDFRDIKDSKKLTAEQREHFYKILTQHPAIGWGMGKASEKIIDRINILQATKLAMKRAIANLETKMLEIGSPRNKYREIRFPRIDFLILDGNFALPAVKIPQKSVVKADEKIFSCMAAGIIAKVARDRLMEKQHKKYPLYGFNKHKGYPTEHHVKMLKKYGRCAIHRNSFNYHDCTQAKTYKIKKK